MKEAADFDELKLKSRSSRQQGWGLLPHHVHWIKLHSVADQARASVRAVFVLMDDIDKDRSCLSTQTYACERVIVRANLHATRSAGVNVAAMLLWMGSASAREDEIEPSAPLAEVFGGRAVIEWGC